MEDIEEMRKFTEGFAYKPKISDYFLERLREMKSIVSIIAHNPEDQERAYHLADIVNWYIKEERKKKE